MTRAFYSVSILNPLVLKFNWIGTHKLGGVLELSNVTRLKGSRPHSALAKYIVEASVCHHKDKSFSWTRAAILPSEVQVICVGVIDDGERHVWSCYTHKMQPKLDPDQTFSDIRSVFLLCFEKKKS